MDPKKKNDDHERNGVMVAFYPTPRQANNIAIPRGTTPDQIHMTLAYLGTVDENLNQGRTRSLLEGDMRVWANRRQGPVRAEAKDLGIFVNKDREVVLHLMVDGGDELTKVGNSVRTTLKDNGWPVRMDYDFNPHITLRYFEDRSTPSRVSKIAQVAKPMAGVGTKFRFGSVSVVWGTARTDIRL